MDTKHISTISGVVGLLGLISQYGLSIIVDRWIESGFDGIIPMVGTAGQTVAIYSLLIDTIGPLVTLTLAVGLGYIVGQRVDMSHEYRRVTGAIAIGSAAGVIVVGAPVFASDVATGTGFTVFMLLATLVSILVSVVLLVTVGALVGTAIAHFRATDPDSFRPTKEGTDSDAPTEATSKSADSSQTQSQPTR